MPGRVTVALDRLRDLTSYPFVEAPLATRDHILLFHTENHWNYIDRKFRKIEFLTKSDPNSTDFVDSDTAISQYTEVAVLRAVGAAIKAVDDIYLRKTTSSTNSDLYLSAFCLVRPPGHHGKFI